MFLGFTNRNISNNDKLLSISNLPLLFYHPLSFGGKCTFPHFLNNKQNSNPHLLWKIEETQLWLNKITFFTYLVLQIQSVIIKTFNFKFENVSFTKLSKRISMIRYITSKVFINLKWRRCNNFFKPIIKGNIKYKKIQPVFLNYCTCTMRLKGPPR